MRAQVTFLRSGGAVFGTAVHHAVVDGASMFHFTRTWATYCRDGESAVVEPPCHDRALLRARSPPVIRPETIP
jgi:shikimate O-hydroxycinnamoyltransferase